MSASEWQLVSFSVDCDQDGYCSVCGGVYEECPCPGPSMEDEYEYVVRSGVLFARPREEGDAP